MKTSIIHVIERDKRMVRVEGDVWESGFWQVSEVKAKQLLSGSIFFHAKQKEPSYFGGTILNYRVQADGKWKGRIVFKFVYSPKCRNIMATPGGWSQEMKISL